MKASEDMLGVLHAQLAQKLIDKVCDEDAGPSWASIATKFLKDNEITCSISENQDMDMLSNSLKEKRAKRKLRIVGEDE